MESDFRPCSKYLAVLRCPDCGLITDGYVSILERVNRPPCARCKSLRVRRVFGRWYKSNRWYKPWTWMMPKCFVPFEMEKEGRYSPP